MLLNMLSEVYNTCTLYTCRQCAIYAHVFPGKYCMYMGTLQMTILSVSLTCAGRAPEGCTRDFGPQRSRETLPHGCGLEIGGYQSPLPSVWGGIRTVLMREGEREREQTLSR